MSNWLKAVLGLLAVLAVIAVGLASWDGLTARPSVRDPVRRFSARIVRDVWGVPHIFGKTDADVAYGIAIAHAEDDFPTLEEVVAAVKGRAGAISGEEGAKIDFARALIGANRDAAFGYATLSPRTRLLVEAYAQGLNLYAEKHPSETRLPGLFPINGRDIVAGFAMRSPFFFGLDRPLGAIVEGRLPPRDAGPPDERGSNGFAVARSKSTDGTVRLIVNSHQPWTGGVTWYELVVHSDEGWDFAGALFPGAPYPLLGHNKSLGWTNTVNRPDLVDVYRLVMDADGTHYRFDGRWMPLTSEIVWLRVKFGPFVLPVPKRIYHAVQGPALRNALGTFAIRYAGFGNVRQVEQYYRLNKARNFAEWKSAMAMQAVNGTNFIYADAAGHVAMLYNAHFPARAKGYDWKGVLPGDTSATLWKSYLPFSAYPFVVDPPAGWVANSNNNPFLSTAPADELDPAQFAPEMGIESYVTNRSLRFQSLFAAHPGPLSRNDLLRIKFDKGYDKAGWAGKFLARVAAVDTRSAADLAAAQRLLATWDWTLDGVGNADTLASVVLGPAARSAYLSKPVPDPAAALRDGVDTLMKTFGRIDVPLGDYQRLRRGKLDLPVYGGPEALRAIIGGPGADGRRVGNNGDGFIMLIEWGPDGAVSSRSIHQFGSATVRTLSPHYADQSPLFVKQQWKPVWFDAAALQGHIERSYTTEK